MWGDSARESQGWKWYRLEGHFFARCAFLAGRQGQGTATRGTPRDSYSDESEIGCTEVGWPSPLPPAPNLISSTWQRLKGQRK